MSLGRRNTGGEIMKDIMISNQEEFEVDGQLYRDHKETVYYLKVDDMYLNNDAEIWYKGE